MTEQNIDAVEVLIRHGEYLLASLDSIQVKVLKGEENIFEQKEIIDLVKAYKDGKAIDQPKFPHLSQENIKKYGAKLRESYAILSHYQEFQSKTEKLLVDLLNQSRDFDLSWNYVFTLPICRLFTLYVKLAVFIIQMHDVYRIAIVYDYCYRKSANKTREPPSLLVSFLKERANYVKITSELQILQSKLFGVFKGIITIMYRLLSAGLSFDWSYLNISDNPSEFDELDSEFPFFKPEYVVMIHFEELCNCFIAYVITNFEVIGDNQQFANVLLLILAHTPYLHMHGNTSFPLFKILEEVKKQRGKKADHGNLTSDKKEEIRKTHIQTRQYRCRKLTMILEEIYNSYSVEPDILSSKFVIIQAALGFAHYTTVSLLSSFHDDNDKLDPKLKSTDVIALIYRMVQIISLIIKKFDNIKRFLIFNLHEYDAPYLQHMIHSFNIPSTEYNRFVTIVNSLQSINIEEYDNGQKYDLLGLAFTLKRCMGSFNKFSTTHGVLHLAPLFNLISALYFRVNIYNQGIKFFKEICPINLYWRFNDVFIEMGEIKSSTNSSYLPAILGLIHFYCINEDTIAEFPQYEKEMQDNAKCILDLIAQSIFRWAKSLQNVGFQQLLNQTSIATVLSKRGHYEKFSNKLPLEEIKPGEESTLKARSTLSPIHSKLSNISDVFMVLREIGIITFFENHKLDAFKVMNIKLKQILIDLFQDETVQTPFELRSKLQNTHFIISYIMTAARIDPGPFYFDCIKELTNAQIEEANGTIVINKNGLGMLVVKYIEFYQEFFKSTLIKSIYATNSQSFISSTNTNAPPSKKEQTFNADLIQVFASKSSIRTIYEILSISGIACIDIVAAETISQLYKDLVSEIKKNVNQNHELMFITDKFNLPNAKTIVDILGQIGAISKFRQLIRDTIPQEETVGKYAFLSNKIRPETDTLLISRIKKHDSIIKHFKAEWFPSLLLSVFCSPYMSQVKYNSNQDSFTNNLHLIALTIDNVYGAILSQDTSFNTVDSYTELLKNIYTGIIEGRENIAKKRCTHWNTPMLILILDHMTKTSQYIDYSVLGKLMSYQFIRSIYTRFLSKKN